MGAMKMSDYIPRSLGLKQRKLIQGKKVYICHQFLSISYWSNSEYWSQKRTQIGNIHSTKLDGYAEKQSAYWVSPNLNRS